MSRRSAVDKKKRKVPHVRDCAYRKSVQIDAVPFELPLEKIINAVSHEDERTVKANGSIRAQELRGNFARIDIVPWRRTVGKIW